MSIKGNVVIFGASTTWGAWDLEKGGWANRLRLFVDSENDDIQTYTCAVSGDTSEDLLRRFQVEAGAREPGVLMMAMGLNDSAFDKELDGNQVAVEDYSKNMQKIMDQAKKFTDKIVFLSLQRVDEERTTPIPWHESISYRNADIERYERALKDVVERNSCLWLDVPVLEPAMLEDGLHPNIEGHEKIFEAARDFIVEKGWV